MMEHTNREGASHHSWGSVCIQFHHLLVDFLSEYEKMFWFEETVITNTVTVSNWPLTIMTFHTMNQLYLNKHSPAISLFLHYSHIFS